eukprot:scaffold11206_cov117-Isochrysis_galbana.AAC.14
MDDKDRVAGACTATPLSMASVSCHMGQSSRACCWCSSAAGFGATTEELPRARGAAERHLCMWLPFMQHVQRRPPHRAAAGAWGLWWPSRRGHA